jgi:hypothetical protein
MADEYGSVLGRIVSGRAASGGGAGSQVSDISKNVFWISANLTFDLQTGATNQILMFVSREEDASILKEMDADAYMKFVSIRAERFSAGIKWYIDPSRLRPNRFVIRGEQDAV